MSAMQQTLKRDSNNDLVPVSAGIVGELFPRKPRSKSTGIQLRRKAALNSFQKQQQSGDVVDYGSSADDISGSETESPASKRSKTRLPKEIKQAFFKAADEQHVKVKNELWMLPDIVVDSHAPSV